MQSLFMAKKKTYDYHNLQLDYIYESYISWCVAENKKGQVASKSKSCSGVEVRRDIHPE